MVESTFENFTASKKVDGIATLATRVFKFESTKDNGPLVQECKRKYANDFEIPYNNLKGYTLNRDGNEAWIAITPRVWEDE